MENLQQAHIDHDISENLAFQLEEVEKNAWSDMYKAAPGGYAENLGITQVTSESMTLISAALPIGLFNKAFMHGLTKELTPDQIREIIDFYSQHHAPKYYVYITPFSKPASAANLLMEQGFVSVSATDKVYCEPSNINLPPDQASALSIQVVNELNAEAWANFICDTYGGLPNQPWLLALVNRKGWHHRVAKKEGKIVACRTMYIDELNRAWLGIDAPIPGIMTAYYEPDYLICKALVSVARDNGVSLVTSCVEFVDETRATDAYTYYYQLGFQVAYLKRNFGLGKG